MWFKNILIYTFKQPSSITHEQLEEALNPLRFQPCKAQEKQRLGFTPVLGPKTEQLVHTIGQQHFVSLTKEEKLIPAQVIQEALNERVQILEDKEQRTVRKKEKQSLKEEITLQLLPRAFSRYSRMHALILPQHNAILIDAASRTKAEELLAQLRKGLGSLPVVPFEVPQPVSQTLTQWVQQGAAPHPFAILQEAELKDTHEEGAVVRFKQQELNEKEVLAHLEAGKVVEKLALTYGESTEFVLTKEADLKRLKFSKELTSTHDELAEDPRVHMDANLSLMCDELSRILDNLLPCLNPAS